jgi:DNA-binding transcriptional regulator GbsR (MarR family)
MERKQVNSSTISTIEYYEEIQLLEVEFKKGTIYHYFDVPKDIYESLIKAKSIGSYFNKNIAKEYAYKKQESE